MEHFPKPFLLTQGNHIFSFLFLKKEEEEKEEGEEEKKIN